jgi:hypothetical protein
MDISGITTVNTLYDVIFNLFFRFILVFFYDCIRSTPASGGFYHLKNVKIWIIETYLRFGIVGTYQKKIGIVGTYQKKSELWEHIKKIEKNRNYGNISIFKNSELWELILKIGIMGTYVNFDNSELWEHIQSELWHLSFGIMGSFRCVHITWKLHYFVAAQFLKKTKKCNFHWSRHVNFMFQISTIEQRALFSLL